MGWMQPGNQATPSKIKYQRIVWISWGWGLAHIRRARYQQLRVRYLNGQILWVRGRQRFYMAQKLVHSRNCCQAFLENNQNAQIRKPYKENLLLNAIRVSFQEIGAFLLGVS